MLQLLYNFNREEILHLTVVKYIVRTLPRKIKTYIFAMIYKT